MTESSCVLCGASSATEIARGTDRLYHTTRERFAVVRCSRCGLLRLSPRPAEHELGQYYPQQYWFEGGTSLAGRLEEIYRKLLIRDHAAFVARAYPGSGPALDVGCGSGLLAGVLRHRGISMFGLDWSTAAARLAWRKHGVPSISGDLRRAPFREGSLGLLTMFHVLEHLTDPRGFLESARKLLRPDGRLVLQVPNAGSLQRRLFGERWSGFDIPRHLTNFRASDLEALLRASGFEVVRRKHFSWRDNPAGCATSIAPGLEPVARRMRALDRSNAQRLLRDLAYLGLTTMCAPLALFEAALHRGSTIMVEAKKAAGSSPPPVMPA